MNEGGGIVMKFDYEYTEIEGYDSQYKNEDFEFGVPVEAIYVKSKVSTDRGNPFIEALPFPRTEGDVVCAYEKGLPDYDLDEAKTLPKTEKLLQLEELKKLRFVLPFHEELEMRFYNALRVSYRMREFVFSRNNGLQRNTKNEDVVQAGRVIGNPADAANAGFSLIGYSGCGKSTAIHTLLSRYPQVIVHKVGDGYFTQIVYLVVNCVANSNFSALYEGIGAAIDRALGNITPTYAAEISKTATLGKKAEKIKGFIDKFGIGAIIFDEIQLIDFSSTRENSFESLLTLVNRTKMALIVVGTEDAKSKMFKELRTARRVGPVISGDLYCGNKSFFSLLVRMLLRYQWFDKTIEATDEIIDALYDVTKGVIDQLISIYTAMHYEYLSRDDKRVKIDADFIRKVAKKYYPEMQYILKNLESIQATNNRILENIALKIMDTKSQNTQMTTMVEEFEEKEKDDVILKNVIKTINMIYDYEEEKIRQEYKKLMKKNSDLTEKEIAQEIIKALENPNKKTNVRKTKTQSRKTTKKATIEEMKTFLNI
jgi:hypothetical protein